MTSKLSTVGSDQDWSILFVLSFLHVHLRVQARAVLICNIDGLLVNGSREVVTELPAESVTVLFDGSSQPTDWKQFHCV